MNQSTWVSLGEIEPLIEELQALGGLKEIALGDKKALLSFVNGQFGAISARCNHMGAPLAQGKIKNGHIECPWHYWQYDPRSGEALHSTSAPLAPCGGKLPSYSLKTENGSLWLDSANATPREQAEYDRSYAPLRLMREPKREPGKIRVLGISTTAMDPEHPRYSTSEDLLKSALDRGEKDLGIESQFLSLSNLNFRHCEGFYSKSEKACAWPCSITKMDPKDEMVKVYEGLVHWCDVVLLATPIRWGAASSLYYKMAERLNTVQNAITLNDKVLIKNKVAGFIITGGQDNIQAVAGQMLNFFGELGFHAPPFPYVGHSLGWSAENMGQNMQYVRESEYLREHSFDLLKRSVDLASLLSNPS